MFFDRSLSINRPVDNAAKKSLLVILQQLIEGGFLKNVCQLVARFDWPHSQFVEALCSMNNLRKLNASDCDLILEQLPHVFRNCPKLTDLHYYSKIPSLFESQTLNINEGVKNELRLGFQRLRFLELVYCIESWPEIREIFT
jgi:hypothetical protein